MPPLQDQATKTGSIFWLSGAVVIGCLLCLAWLLAALASVLSPFVIGIALAFLLHPCVNALTKPREKPHPVLRLFAAGAWPRWLAVLVVEILALLLLLALSLLLIPIVTQEAQMLRQRLPDNVDQWLQTPALQTIWLHISTWAAAFGLSLPSDIEALRQTLLEALRQWLAGDQADVLSQVWGSVWLSLQLGSNVLGALLLNAVLMPLVLYYALLDGQHWLDKLRRLIPVRWQGTVVQVSSESHMVLGQYLRGQLAVMLCLALFYSVGLSLFGLTLAIPIGVLTGLAIAIPYVGFALGLLLAFVAGSLEMGLQHSLLMVAVVYGSGQLLEGFYLTPRWVGERIGLHPLAVIFALLAFGSLFGFLGVLLALPASAVLLVLLRHARARYVQTRFYTQPLPPKA